ncbi:sensor histidine kinase [Ammoniphilus sp. CFH 90114]|uniref:sensor histidine kinase n=1 Tax=Ammoniphilus sp. CFH 90114 TaxID=2493665 RepID=UPI00100FE498|nr:sensor histidine kinase [Ammoniphilus sp. CFH 90114]RXT06574.1 HAMP domain-containing histidine kinase [Ammoniphilus sp. CFH 90114]
MIKKFLIERRSWILFFLSLQFLILFITYLDSSIPLYSIIYIVFLSLIVFTLFLVTRYVKETKFYRSLETWENSLDIKNLMDPTSPYEHLIYEAIVNQTDALKQSATQNSLILEQEKEELLAWIHEVKTPLTAMYLMIGRLDESKVKSSLMYEWLRVHLLLDQQLHQKRIHFIENDLYIENLHLPSIIHGEIRALQSICIQKGIGFDLELEVLSELSDAKWLSYIIRQLLTNAVKYCEASDITIRSFQQKDQTILEVEDRGRGIDPRDLPRIFDKGFTSTLQHHNHAATGMGLYLAQRAAQSLFIQMTVNSQLGVGTTFRLTFPKRNDFHQTTGM